MKLINADSLKRWIYDLPSLEPEQAENVCALIDNFPPAEKVVIRREHFDDTDKAILTDYINKIIREAIDHGGDSGGPYFVNGEELHDAMRRLKMWLSLKDYVICGGKKYYMYYEKLISEEEEWYKE